ncbi:MAG TPA: tetratricopeptide repeat protein [Candidatus Dormibacteraeota bacterium]|nr:tetratricopeptide repeat protein [Candidatus Dormibacteraeota bacterium]
MAKAGSERQSTIESLKERIARDPLSRAFLQLAEEYRRDGRYKEAVEVCLEGLARHPTYHTARISLGRTYMEAGDLENARRAFSDVLELQPENHLAGKLLAEVQKKMGDVRGAARTYQAILGQYPHDKEVESLLRQVQGGPSATSPPAAAVGPPAPPAPAPPSSAPVTRTSVLVPPVNERVGPALRQRDPAPEFRAEDLGGAGFAVAGEMVAAPGGPSPAPGNGAPEAEEADDDALQTNTLAELYLRQGLVDRAIEVYRGMLRVDPGNHKAARRLSELLSTCGGGPAGATAGGHATEGRHGPGPASGVVPAPASTVAEPAVTMQSMRPATAGAPQPASPRDRRVLRLERWLEGIRAAAAREAGPR